MAQIIKFEIDEADIKGTDTISSLTHKAITQKYKNSIHYLDYYFRDTYIIDGNKYRIGKEATFKNLYIEKVED